MSGFSNPVVGGGGDLVRERIRSPDYVASTTGWSINQDGSAEFNQVTVRGEIDVGTANQYTKIYDAPPPVDGPAVVFNSDAATFSQSDGFIRAIAAGPGSAYGALMLSSPEAPGQTAAQITLVSGDGTNERVADVFGDLDVNGDLIVEPVAGNIVLQVDDLAATLAVLLKANGGITLPAGKYIKRGGMGNPTFLAGWSNFAGGFQDVKYIEYPQCEAGIVGVAGGGTATNGTVMFTIPAGLRPAFDHTFDAPCNNGKHTQIIVSDQGNVQIANPDTAITWISFNNIRWPIAGF